MTDDIEEKKAHFKGVFYYIDKDGNPTDEGIVDEMLQDCEDENTETLIRMGVINDMRIRLPKKS